jgi:urease accessory protein
MLRIESVLGNVRDAPFADAVHRLAHDGVVEYLFIEETDTGRRRIRLDTDRGTDCAVSLPRDESLKDGAVLFLDQTRAVVVRVGAPRTLRLRPTSADGALRLGWHAGNLHWRVRFEDSTLVVLLDGPRADYLVRLGALVEGGVDVVDDHRH